MALYLCFKAKSLILSKTMLALTNCNFWKGVTKHIKHIFKHFIVNVPPNLTLSPSVRSCLTLLVCLIIYDSFYFNRVPQKLASGSVILFNNSLSVFSPKPGKLNFFTVILIIPSHILFPFSTNDGHSAVWFVRIVLIVRISEKKYGWKWAFSVPTLMQSFPWISCSEEKYKCFVATQPHIIMRTILETKWQTWHRCVPKSFKNITTALSFVPSGFLKERLRAGKSMKGKTCLTLAFSFSSCVYTKEPFLACS